MKEKNKRLIKRLQGKTLCPVCKADLVEEGIGFSEHGEQTWIVKLRKNKLHYVEDDFFESGETEFYCVNCAATLDLTKEEVLEILKL